MRSMVPNRFRDGILRPDAINQNFREHDRELRDIFEKRYTHFQMEVDFGVVDAADDPAEFRLDTVPPESTGYIEVIGAEMVVWASSSAQSFTAELYVDEVKPDAWEDLTVAGSDGGSTVPAYGASTVFARVAAEQVLSLRLASGFGTAVRVSVTLHCRHDRLLGVSPQTFVPPVVDASNADDASVLNAGLDAINDDIAASQARHLSLRATALRFTRNYSGGTKSWALPQFSGYIENLDLCGTGAASKTLTLRIKDEAATSVGSVLLSFTGPGSFKAGQATVRAQQPADDPGDQADDWEIEWAPGGAGAVNSAFGVIWWWDVFISPVSATILTEASEDLITEAGENIATE